MKINPQFELGRVREILPASLQASANKLEIPQLSSKPVEDGQKFPLGKVVTTALVRDKICPFCVGGALRCHAFGDWGEVSQWDALANEEALKTGKRILSVFTCSQGGRFFVITEPDRTLTTVCLPEEA